MPGLFIPRGLSVVLLEGAIVLVDGVVRQVHEKVVHVPSVGFDVGLCAKSCDSFLVDVDPQRVDSVDEDVDAQVVLEVVD